MVNSLKSPQGLVYYYIETDGLVYLEEQAGKLTFPTRIDHLPFKVEIRQVMPLAKITGQVLYCEPVIDYYPRDWLLKDDILVKDNIDPIVRQAITYSYVRHVVSAIVTRPGPDGEPEFLMVKPTRGISLGYWNVPSGFIHYAESPQEALLREVKEETGYTVTISRLIGVYSHVGEWPGAYYMLSIYYECLDTGMAPGVPHADEIGEVSFIPQKQMLAVARPGGFLYRAYQDWARLGERP